MRWYSWTALGLGAWWLLKPKSAPAASTAPSVSLPTTGVTTGAVAQQALTETIYQQLIQAVQNAWGLRVTNVSMTQDANGLHFTGQALAQDGQSYVTIKLGDFASADDVVAKIKAGWPLSTQTAIV